MNIAQTDRIINADIAEVWDKVCFYEEVKTRPNWFLRWTLPLPVRTVGDHKTVGTLCRCEYGNNQYIMKRITKSVHNAALEFSVTEASEQFQRHLALKGGSIYLESLRDGRTLVSMATSYEPKGSGNVVRHLIVDHIIRSMHRFVMGDMANSIRHARKTQPASC
ncbi:hypothetical protein [Pseudoduganella violaceinigra]|uniref:hypothetical protein n=1 Tax=Pseudoduganella violaceinigra TaxID=246602 RepID=UPI0004258150|nr:hypothetical protein [Pseudoduganella violaceinigra]